MKKKKFLACLFLLIGMNAFAQTSFEKIIGSTGNDYVYSVVKTSDDGYLLSGITSSFGAGAQDVFVTRYDATGTEIWTKTYGGTGEEQRLSMAIELADGNYFIAAHTESFGSAGRDGYFLKIDVNGAIIWNKRYSINSNETIRGVVQLSNGDILISGACNSVIGATDAILLKLNHVTGAEIYSKIYGGAGLDNLERAKVMPDGNLILAGNLSTWGPSGQNGALIKTDINGNILWEKVYGGNGGDAIQDIEVLSNNSFIVSLSGNSWGSGGIDGNIMKMDDLGNIVWAKNFGGSGDEELKDLIVLPSGNILAYGWTTSFGAGQKDLLLLKTDANGNLIWAKTFGGSNLEPLEQGDLTFTLTDDMNILIGGSSNSFGSGYQGIFIQTDTSGVRFCNNVTSSILTTNPTITTAISSVTITTAGTYSTPTTIVNSPTMPSSVGCNCDPGFSRMDLVYEIDNCYTYDFSQTYDGYFTTIAWDFGDAQSSTSVNPSHTYAADGNYTVCVTLTNVCGNDTTICTTITVGNCGCASFDDVEITSLIGESLGVTFGNTYPDAITDYWWDFGDNQFSNSANPIHHYDSAGVYWVCLTITNSCGDDTTICDSVVVSEPCDSFVDVALVYTTNGFSVNFDNTYTGNITEYWWDFGDNQFSNIATPTHNYSVDSTYYVCLTITNDCDEDTTVCDSVTVMVSPKGINDFANSIGLNYFPNPVNDILTIVTKANVELSIYSLAGSLIRTEGILSGNHRIDLSVLAEGVYMLQFRNDSGSYQDKLIITR